MKIGDKVTLIKSFGHDKPLIVTQISDCGKLIKMKHQVTGVTVTRSNNEGEWFLVSEINANMSHSDFMNFLDDNPPNEVQETTEPTEEQKIAWQADLDAENRRAQEDNLFYNS